MIFTLPEIQITCVIIMALLTLVMTFIVPRYGMSGSTFAVTRRLAIAATSLVAVHFVIQYIVHKNETSVETTRTVINLVFGFPISYFFTMSLAYLLRKGRITMWEWSVVPVIYMVSVMVFTVAVAVHFSLDEVMPFIAFLYALALLFFSMMMIREYYVIRRKQKAGDRSYDSILRWTRWSIFLMSGVGFGFPVMTFVPDITARSVYGIISISVAFIYILGLMGYSLEGLNLASQSGGKSADGSRNGDSGQWSVEDTSVKEVEHAVTIDEARLAKVRMETKKFVENRRFTLPGVTLKDAANDMNVSVHLLKNWLHTTEYEKFNNWILQLRINYAKELLMDNPELSSDDVARRCGFCDRQYYQAQFRKHVGVTPAKWVQGVPSPKDKDR